MTNDITTSTNTIKETKIIKDVVKSPEVTIRHTQEKYNRPKTGVVSAPFISKSPVSDTIEITRQEHPKINYNNYKLGSKPKGDFQKYASLGVFVLGFSALMKLVKGVFKK